MKAAAFRGLRGQAWMRGFSCVRMSTLAGLATAAALGFILSGCSSTASLYPAVLSDPPPLDEPTLSPEQVKQATEKLISDRNRLCSQAAADSSGAPPPNCAPDNVVLTGATQKAGAGGKP
jgi:hypothetical protein